MELVQLYHQDLYFESAVMILALITVGKYLETRSKGKTSEALTRLMDLAPKTATVERNGQQLEVPVEQVVVGDMVLVKPGQRIPVDGLIAEGSTSVDQSAITGESIPVEKNRATKLLPPLSTKAALFALQPPRLVTTPPLHKSFVWWKMRRPPKRLSQIG